MKTDWSSLGTRGWSIRRGLVRSILLMFGLYSAFCTGVVWFVARSEYREFIDHELQNLATVMVDVVDLYGIEYLEQRGYHAFKNNNTHFVWQIVRLPDWRVVAKSANGPTLPIVTRMSTVPLVDATDEWRVVTLELQQHPGLVFLLAHEGIETDELLTYLLFSVIAGSALLGVAMGYLMYRRIGFELQPLARLSKQLQDFDPLESQTQAPVLLQEELRPIERAITDLGQRLAQRVAHERAFSSHAAHALRNPVAGIDIQLAVLLREAPEAMRPRLRKVREANRKLGAVIKALLAFFRTESAPEIRDIALSDILAPLAYDELAIEWEVDLLMRVDPDLFTAALLNIVDNAQRHRAKRLQVRAWLIDSWFHLELRDDGEGCPLARRQDLAMMLAQPAGTLGSEHFGLGLSLVGMVIRAHRGQLNLLDVPTGFGLALTWPWQSVVQHPATSPRRPDSEVLPRT